MRKIKDTKGKTFAHLVGKGTIEIKRSNQTFIITGKDFSILGTSAFSPDTKEFVVVENGKLVEDGLKIVDDALSDEELEQAEAEKKTEVESENDALEKKPEDEDGGEKDEEDAKKQDTDIDDDKKSS